MSNRIIVVVAAAAALAGAKVVAADTNADQKVDVNDVKDDDVVLVQARVARRTKYAQDAEGDRRPS